MKSTEHFHNLWMGSPSSEAVTNPEEKIGRCQSLFRCCDKMAKGNLRKRESVRVPVSIMAGKAQQQQAGEQELAFHIFKLEREQEWARFELAKPASRPP